jgi:RNA polymerase sigma factor (sigma-70 family)
MPTVAIAPTVDLDRFLAEDYGAVVAAVALVTGNRSTAEDAVQDALVKLLSSPPAEPLRSTAAWITVVASNNARSTHRRRGVERRKLTTIAARPSADGGDPATTVADNDVTAALRLLPVQQRQVCVLHYYVDASVADISSALGVSEGTVKTQLHRARRALAVLLGEPEPTDDAEDGDHV